MQIRALLAIFVSLIVLPSVSLATSCEDIVGRGSYQDSGKFTRAPSYLGCAIGQLIGGVVGVPVTVVYAPAAGLSGHAKGKDLRSPIEDGAELGGNVVSHLLGFPFFLVETIFRSGSSYDQSAH